MEWIKSDSKAFFSLLICVMVSVLNMLTWNVTGIMSSSLYLAKALKAHDISICGISEHMLKPETVCFLESIDNDYNCLATVDFSLHPVFTNRIGKGGVCLLWHKRLDNIVEPLQIEPPDDRIIGIKVTLSDNEILYVFQVYLPTTRYTVELYQNYIDKLCELSSSYGSLGRVVIMGDFNGHFKGERYFGALNPRDRFLQQLLDDCGMFCLTTSSLCTGEQWSYVPSGYGSPSLIDHIVIPNTAVDTVNDCIILSDEFLEVSNHRPIKFSLSYSHTDIIEDHIKDHTRVRYKWKSADLDAYRYTLDDLLLQTLPCEMNNDNLETYYNTMVDCFVKAASQNVPKTGFKPFLKPYWNRELKALHKSMRQARSIWISEGKPRGLDFHSYALYKATKREFRCKMRQHHDNYIMQQFDQIC